MKPLDGIKVLDLSRVLAGPWCTQLLADLGAEVIKIERPGSGDDTRHWGPPWHGEGDRRVAAYFLSANRGKKSAAIDLGTAEGAALVRKLAGQADVVVENFKVGGLAKFGLDASLVRAANPRLVYASITGFGQDGPYADRAGYDYIIQGMGGLMSITGQPDGAPGGGPMRVGVAVVDLFTGLYTSHGDPRGAVRREKTGRGRAHRHGAVRHPAGDACQSGVERAGFRRGPDAPGHAHPNIVPYQLFEAADQPIIVAVGNDRQFAGSRRCAAACGMGERRAPLRAMPRGSANRAEIAAGRRLHPHQGRPPTGRPSSKLPGIPSGPINSVDPSARATSRRSTG